MLHRHVGRVQVSPKHQTEVGDQLPTPAALLQAWGGHSPLNSMLGAPQGPYRHFAEWGISCPYH